MRRQRADLVDEMEAEMARTRSETSADRIPLEELSVQPRKTDIAVAELVLAWTPLRIGAVGDWPPAC